MNIKIYSALLLIVFILIETISYYGCSKQLASNDGYECFIYSVSYDSFANKSKAICKFYNYIISSDEEGCPIFLYSVKEDGESIESRLYYAVYNNQGNYLIKRYIGSQMTLETTTLMSKKEKLKIVKSASGIKKIFSVKTCENIYIGGHYASILCLNEEGCPIFGRTFERTVGSYLLKGDDEQRCYSDIITTILKY